MKPPRTRPVRMFCFLLPCLFWAVTSSPGQAKQKSPSRGEHREPAGPGGKAATKSLTGDERILHALNRLTFGPGPEDLDAVRQIGLDAWIDRQLRPASLDTSDLERRLSELPAMRLSTAQLLTAFPSGAILRQAAEGKLAAPATPILKAVYGDQVAFLKEREARKAEAKSEAGIAAPANPKAMQAGTPASPAASMNPAAGAASGITYPPGPGNASALEDERPAPSEAEIATLLVLPPGQRLKRLLAMTPPQLQDFRAVLKGARRERLLDGMSPGQREIVADLENPARAVVDELMEQRLIRDVYSPAQLQEVMTGFWLNHFNLYLHKNEEMPYYLVSFERDVIRPRALGRFEDLLVATAESPAMLLYLDNSSSMGPDSASAEKQKQRSAKLNQPAPPEGLNENYARELMELHTLGVNGGYTQHDVTEMARVFTGWTVDQPARGGGFLFDERKHEPGPKKLLGVTVEEGGQNEGLEMLHLLATRPATARFLCRKLAVYFVADDPPQSLVDRMVKSYLASGGEIAAVLRTMLRSPEFWQAGRYRSKVKTPLEYVVSAARASRVETGSLLPLAQAVDRMGMPLYGCVPPSGYSAQAEAWVSTGALVDRMNFALALASNKLPGIHAAWSPDGEGGELETEVAAAPPPQFDAVGEEHRLENQLLAGGISEPTRAAVMEQFVNQPAPQPGAQKEDVKAGSAPAQPVRASTRPAGRPGPTRPASLPPAPAAWASREKEDALLAGLLLGSPEFQRR